MALSKPAYSASYVEEMLECSVCLDTVKDPHTLQQCFHSFCKDCIEQLIQKQDNPKPGVDCPVCRTFSEKDEIRGNFFIKDLATMYRSTKDNKKAVCEQCSAAGEDKEATVTCMDCRMNLCTVCQSRHLSIKMLQGHRVVPITERGEMIVDQLIFCNHHKDKPIELFCKPCKLPICMKCKATTHDGHKSETVEEALERLVPEIEDNISFVDQNNEDINKSLCDINRKIDEVKQSFVECCKLVDETAELRVKDIHLTQKQLKESLNSQEKEEIDQLQKIKENLEKKQKEGENLKRVVRTNIDRARHATLLTELVQGGLQEKLQSVKQKEQPISHKTKKPRLEINTLQWNKQKYEGFLGKVIYTFINVAVCMGGIVVDDGKSSTRYWPYMLKEYFGKHYRKTKEIILPDSCNNFSIIKNHIWTPLNYKNKIQVYNKAGNLIKNINIERPISVELAHNMDILIACSDNFGLHVIHNNYQPCKVTNGSFSDVCRYKDKVYAVEYKNKMICEFHCIEGSWVKIRHIDLEKYANPSVIDNVIVNQTHDQTGLQFFISSWNYCTIYKYNEQGKCLNQYGSHIGQGDWKLSRPYICGADIQGNVLVADSGNNVYKILNTVTRECNSTGLKGECRVYDAKTDSDGCLWLLEYNGNNSYMTKHES